MGFVRDWQKKLGYRHDPFQAIPSKKVSDYFVDREEEREALNLFIIKQKRFGLLHGPQGIGKTTLAAWLHEQVGDNSILLSPKVQKEFFNTLMHASLNLVERTITKPHEKVKGEQLQALLLKKLARRELLIIIDNANELQNDQKWLIKQILESCDKIQIILIVERVIKEYENYGVDDLNLELKDMPKDQLALLLQRRIEFAGSQGTWPFDEKEIATMITKSKQNPVKLLEHAKDRAIELSLKVKDVPKPLPKQNQKTAEPTSTESDELPSYTENKTVEQTSRSWFKLVRNDEERIAYEQAAQSANPQPVVQKIEPSDQALQEAAELEAALSAALEETAPKKEQKTPVETKSTTHTTAKHEAVHIPQAHKGPITHSRRRGR